MPSPRIAQIEERLSKVHGPWRLAATWPSNHRDPDPEADTVVDSQGEPVILPQDEQGGPSWSEGADVDLIVNAPADLAYLVERVRHLESAYESALSAGEDLAARLEKTERWTH